LQAQSNFKPGYVIKSEGDTLFGEIDYRGNQRMGEICTFRSNHKATVEHFAANEIEGYRLIDSKYYISRKLNDKKVFLEFLIKGRLNMYYYRNKTGDHFYFDKEGVPLTELPYMDKAVEDENGLKYEKTNKYVGLLSYYLNDAPGLIPEINRIKAPDHQNLIELATNYHKAVCDGDKCIIYEKKLPAFKINLEIAGGVVKGLYDGNDTQTTKFQGGLLAYVWIPGISENLYIRVGFMYTTCQYIVYDYQGLLHTFHNADGSVYKIPLHLEYIFPRGIIRPKISAGLDIYAANNKSNYTYKAYGPLQSGDGIKGLSIMELPQIMVGVNIKLTKTLFLSVNYEIINYPGLTTGLYICL